MGTLSFVQIAKLKKLYIDQKMSMREIAEKFNVSIDAIVYGMRKQNIPRRSFKETNALLFENKKPSFVRVNNPSKTTKELMLVGAMLYWAEGYKSVKGATVDFANSDSEMIKLFLLFLRTAYVLDEGRFRVYLYCYANQDIEQLCQFWSIVTAIPINQFSKPYVRNDYKENGRKMTYGMIHIRYGDKKLLLDILSLIVQYKDQYCVGGRAVKYSGL